MSVTILISGRLLRDPERKLSKKTGKPFVAAVIKEGDGDAMVWWNALVFSESGCEELLSLRAGDGVAASGSFRAEIYEKAGAQRISYTVFADRLISAKRQKREKATERRDDQPRSAAYESTRADDDDVVPF